MNYLGISTLYLPGCAWDSALKNIDASMKILTFPILLLHWRYFKKIFDGSQSHSYGRIILWTLCSRLSVVGCVTSPQADPYIFIGINRSSDSSILSFIYGSVGSLHIWIPNFWPWFGVISNFSILFPNHRPCLNSSITASPESSVNVVTPVHIGTFICSVYSVRNVNTVHSSEVNDIVRKLSPK